MTVMPMVVPPGHEEGGLPGRAGVVPIHGAPTQVVPTPTVQPGPGRLHRVGAPAHSGALFTTRPTGVAAGQPRPAQRGTSPPPGPVGGKSITTPSWPG